jgi:hypothetical protein
MPPPDVHSCTDERRRRRSSIAPTQCSYEGDAPPGRRQAGSLCMLCYNTPSPGRGGGVEAASGHPSSPFGALDQMSKLRAMQMSENLVLATRLKPAAENAWRTPARREYRTRQRPEEPGPAAYLHLEFCEPRQRTRAARTGPTAHWCGTRTQLNQPGSRLENQRIEPAARPGSKAEALPPKRQ